MVIEYRMTEPFYAVAAAKALALLAGPRDRGVGDTVARIAAATGIGPAAAAAIKVLTDGDCGCPARQRALNERFRYRRGR